jgi:hypothetical protein
MKKIVLSILLCLSSIMSVASGKTLSVRLIDDQGNPVAGADALIWFRPPVTREGDEQKHTSDANGQINASGDTYIGMSVIARKKGYYTITDHDLPPWDKVERTYVMRRVLNPIPLHVLDLSFGSGLGLKFSKREAALGYDLKVGDWVAPHGKGEVADIQFKFKNEFKGWLAEEENRARALEISKASAKQSGKTFSEEEFKFSAGKWDGVLEMSFPNPQEGILEEVENYHTYSDLRLPHQAPEFGYQSSRRYEASTYKGRPDAKPLGFFLRTRVKLDEKGRIVSANYAKIYGDFFLDARGTLNFHYYFNPTPNDRNLEFDPTRNLFPKDKAHTATLNP